ncbi:C-C motif chemokine 3-like [Neoarius graeffei]|uniref:C-C motif chemokine 3-like n=1 Tax=Neoarius graeffei TaxID=443677 RepID=UPI00298C79F4|nr:C-C motif chemokine 3-like [Neoarius graeffei]
MFSRSLLLVLLVLVCLQSFTSAESADEPTKCCFSHHKKRTPANIITAYKVTHIKCRKPGVIFTLKIGKEMCAHPEDEWVKRVMELIDQRKFTTTDAVNTHQKTSG